MSGSKNTNGNGWPRVKLKDVAEHCLGKMLDSKKNRGRLLPYLRNPNVKWFDVDVSNLQLMPFEEREDERFGLRAGDIVICEGGEAGRAAIWDGSILDLKFQKAIHRVRPHAELDARYFVHQLKADYESGRLADYYTGTTIKHLTGQDLAKYEFPLPPVPEQRRIAAILDKADSLWAQRRAAIAQLDALIQSIFLDMFGDPIANPKNWDTRTLPELILPGKNSLKRGPFGGALKKEIFVDSGYLVYEQNHALNNDYSFGRYFITKEKYKELISFSVKPNDIIISCSGVYLGKLSIVPEGAKPGIINQALLKVSLDQAKMKTVVFAYIFGSPQFKREYFPSNRGVAIPNLPPMDVMKTIGFITPPVEIQQQFTAIVESAEQQKARMRVHLAELDTLFASLQHRAFRGEL